MNPLGTDLNRPPVKPRPILFTMLCVVFALWMLMLAFLYLRTVYPMRHPH